MFALLTTWIVRHGATVPGSHDRIRVVPRGLGSRTFARGVTGGGATSVVLALVGIGAIAGTGDMVSGDALGRCAAIFGQRQPCRHDMVRGPSPRRSS
jgi:hypothetical protein